MKFRVWMKQVNYPQNERMHPKKSQGFSGEGVEIRSHGQIILKEYYSMGGENSHDITNKCIFLEYIGREDKNGKEICDGDILECYSVPNMFKWIVRHSKKHCGFVIVNIGVDGYLGEEFPINSEYFFEDRIIVGNIYENPELK